MKAAIENKNEKWIQAFRESESEIIADLFCEDGQMFLEGGMILNTKEEIAEKIASFMMIVGQLETKIQMQSLWEQNDTAFETGHFIYTAIPSGKEFSRGSYVIEWKKTSSGMKIKKYISTETHTW